MCVLLTAPVVRQTTGRWCWCVHTACWCVSLGSHKTPIMSVHRLNWLVFVMKTQCVYHEITTKLPWFSRLVAILSARWPGFDLKAVHVRFVVDKVALGQVSLPALLCSPAITTAPRLCIYLHFNTVLIGTNGWVMGTFEQSYALSDVTTGQKYFNPLLRTVTITKFASLCSACNLRHSLSSKCADVFGTHKKTHLIPFI
jgi:hypothetical protein